MSDTFWCRGCQQHKKVISRSLGHKIGGALCCGSCEENMAKRFSARGAKLQAAKVRDTNNRPEHFARHLEERCSTL